MTSSENGAEPLLSLSGVSKNFGPVQALIDVTSTYGQER